MFFLPVVEEDINALFTANNSSKNLNNTNFNSPPPKDALLDISETTLRYEQQKDTDIKKIISDNINNIIPDFKNYIICDRFLLLFFNSNSAKPNKESAQYKIVVSKSVREKCIQIHHITHYGIKKTYKNIRTKFYGKGIYSNIVNYVRSCTRCLLNMPQRVPAAPPPFRIQ